MVFFIFALMKFNPITLAALAFMSLFITACDDEEVVYSPKPRGFPRIDFPKKEYRLYDSTCPYKFEIPVYSRVAKDNNCVEPCCLNLEFPKFKATLYMGYREVKNNIATYLEDSHYFANKHQVKASGLDEIAILRDSAQVYGLLFDISGNTASSLQFYVTDSTRHFLRGSLYFNTIPNIDSLQIVVDFIKADVLHMINTTSWKRD